MDWVKRSPTPMTKTKRFLRWANTQKTFSIGTHIVADFWFGESIEKVETLKKLLLKAAKEANNTPLKVSIHKFSPRGITGVLLLSESHITFHTWPEIGYVAIDIFTCGKRAKPQKALQFFRKILKPKYLSIKTLKRGKAKRTFFSAL